MINSLPIWNDTSDLSWYRSVADNLLPAKYLIARRIPAPDDYKERPTDMLWELHAELSDRQEMLRKKVKHEPMELEDTPKSPSLLDLNVELVNRMLTSCTFCQWHCEVDRTLPDDDPQAKTGTCQLGEESRVGSYFHHRGEELLYRGRKGSGTIFFTSCNMRCVFCQNGNISQDRFNGRSTSVEELTAIIWLLRMEGCHNINFVGGDPTIHLHTILRAVAKLKMEGPPLRVLRNVRKVKSDSFISYNLDSDNAEYRRTGEFNAPMLWNANFFMSMDAMKLLRTVMDIWLPDFKFGPNKKCATLLSRTPWYWDTVRRNLKQIHNWGEDFTVRHLVMPNHVECCTFPILDWVAENLPGTQINIMDQYHPDSFTNPHTRKYNPRYEEISRQLYQSEWKMALGHADDLGLDYRTISFS